MKVIKKSEFDELFKEYLLDNDYNSPLEIVILNKVWMILQEKSFELDITQDNYE